ncbi:MAG TPA: SCO family protein [Candidatus Angelobacter sp.]|nr:SCO family protein [Candidatus Angelobacter sp.]
MRRKWAGFAASIAIFITAIFFITTNPTPAAASARWGANYFPNVVLTTQDGKQVHFYDDLLKGKIVVIDLIYTHCVNACPLETARLVQVQKMLGDRVGKDIFFYSISIDPKHDTPKVLKEYAQKFHVGPGWTFLTGKQEDIELVGRKLGLYQDPDPNDPDGHAPTVLIGDEPGGQWINNSATDNPRFITNMIEGWLDNWKHVQSAKLAKGESTAVNYEAVPHIDLSNRGRYIFGSQCAACHTIGHGDKIGPDLFGVASVRETEWLRRFITEPDKVIAEKDPIAVALYKKYQQVNMPNTRLTKEDVNELVKFLQSQVATPPAKETAEPAKTSAVTTESSASPVQQ